MSHITGKVWGTTSLLYRSPVLEIHRLVVNPNSYCSLHKHTVKNNSFYVLRGTLFIEVHKSSYPLVDTTILKEGDFTTVPPGEFHKFYTTGSEAHVLEIYHLEPLSDDIIRQDHGGSSPDKILNIEGYQHHERTDGTGTPPPTGEPSTSKSQR